MRCGKLLKKSGHQPAIRTPDLAAGFRGVRSAILALPVISGIISLLALTGSLYTLQVYDRISSSPGVLTLVSLFVIMLVLYAFYGMLNLLRNQALGRTAALFDRRITSLVRAVILLQAAGCGIATALAQEPIPVKREILALYDGAQEGDADLTRIHRFAEMPLNYLGFILRLHDIRTKLPDPAEMERYRGVLTWFVGSVADSNAYLAWASQVSRMDVRYVILGDIGIVIHSANILAVNRLLDLAGVHHTGDYVGPTLGTRVLQKDPSLIEFECRLDPVLSDYPVITVNRRATRTGLMLETPSDDGRRKTVLVAIGERGAYAALNYEFCHQRSPLYQGKWLIDPFALFRAAFGSDDQPIPDTTTASGNRLYFSTLDSEGWTRSSKIEGFSDTPVIAGEVVLHELIEPFNGLPTTVHLQNNEFAEPGRNGRQMGLAPQRLLAIGNIDLSKRFLRATFSRFDPEYPSISNLSPLIGAGSDHLINEPMSDDRSYSQGAPIGESGFSGFKATVTNTESPRRLKPFNLNYHAYAGENPALLRSVKERLREASLAALTPVSANRYAAIVDGFFRARVDRIGSASWRISNRGELQTVRFDAAEGREVDFQSSVGVIGQKRNGATIYIALDEAIDPAVVVLAPATFSRTAYRGLALVESRWLVRHVVKSDCALSFEAQGYGEGSFTWSDANSGRYTITVERAGHEVWRQTAEADGSGTVKFVLPISAIDPVTVRMNCASAVGSAEQ
jgi:hypothetical protein